MSDEQQNTDPDLEPLEAIYDALDAGAAEEASRLARQAIAAGAGDDPVLHFLAGVAALELEQNDEALRSLSRACELDPDDAEFRARLAEAHYRAARFDDAEREARRAVASDPALPHARWALGLALEYTQGLEAADREFARASRLDPEEFLAPVRMTDAEFERHLTLAMDALPRTFREPLGQVAVTVEALPSAEILLAEQPPLDPELLGLFVGTPLTERSVFAGVGDLPPRILLFKRNLERHALDAEELREEIAVTLRHELAHYLGLDEEEIEQAGHA